MGRLFTFSCLLAMAIAAGGTARGQDAGIEFFEKKIRPVLVEHCYECHSHQARKHRGELYLDSRDGMRKGGENGPAVVPGKPPEGGILRALGPVSPDPNMPPAPPAKLPAQVLEYFQQVR